MSAVFSKCEVKWRLIFKTDLKTKVSGVESFRWRKYFIPLEKFKIIFFWEFDELHNLQNLSEYFWLPCQLKTVYKYALNIT
jgi:hypothetical protein